MMLLLSPSWLPSALRQALLFDVTVHTAFLDDLQNVNNAPENHLKLLDELLVEV